MFTPSRHCLCLVALIATGLAAGSAQARNTAPLPATPRPHLAVVDTGGEFSIQTTPTGAPCTARSSGAAAGKLALGFNLKLDRSLFSAAGQTVSEASDAPHR